MMYLIRTPPSRFRFFVPNQPIWARRSPLAPAAHALAGLADGAGLLPMDPAEVPDQSEPRRRAARDHQPAFQRGRARCVARKLTLKVAVEFFASF